MNIEALRTRSRTENGQAVYMTQSELDELCALAALASQLIEQMAIIEAAAHRYARAVPRKPNHSLGDRDGTF